MAEKAVSLERLKRFKTKADARYAYKSHGNHVPDYCESITSWNSVTKSGWYVCGSSSSAPASYKTYFGRVIVQSSTGSTFQEIWCPDDSRVAKLAHYVRGKASSTGSWSAWKDVTVCRDVPENAVFTDTWRGIVNSLTSTSTTYSLSAAQGKALNDRLTAIESWKTNVLAGETPVFVVTDTAAAAVSVSDLPSMSVAPQASKIEVAAKTTDTELPGISIVPVV